MQWTAAAGEEILAWFDFVPIQYEDYVKLGWGWQGLWKWLRILVKVYFKFIVSKDVEWKYDGDQQDFIGAELAFSRTVGLVILKHDHHHIFTLNDSHVPISIHLYYFI